MSDQHLMSKLRASVHLAQPILHVLLPARNCSKTCSSANTGCKLQEEEQSQQSCDSKYDQEDDVLGSNSAGSSSSPVGQQDVPVLLSGAGHDAMAIADMTKFGMVFVRCKGGLSHNPAEHVDPQDVSAAAVALATFLEMDTLDAAHYNLENFGFRRLGDAAD